MDESDSPDEALRLAAVERYDVCDGAAVASDDLADFVSLAAHICKAPMAVLSFVGAGRVAYKARCGIALSGVARDESFCAEAIKGADILIVCDAMSDARFARSRLVTLDPFVRFYAGVPLRTTEGQAIGTLAVMDHTRRSLGRGQREGLRALARRAMRHLELSQLSCVAQDAATRFAASQLDEGTDSLTKLPHQIRFKELLDGIVFPAAQTAPLGALQHAVAAAVMFVNLDRFRVINETLGYETGDLLLQQVADRLKSCTGAQDTVARFGSDEFALIIRRGEDDEGGSDEAASARVAQKILETLSLPFNICDRELFVTASIGIGLYPRDGRTAQTLLKSAGIALRHAKEQDGNSAQIYTAGRTTKALKELVLENSLRRGLERAEFQLHYQPQVRVNGSYLVGVEALVRWQHPELGLLSPNEFIPLAEDSGMIVRLGEWVTRTACAQNKAWQDAGYAPLRMSVNLSARQFQQPDIKETLMRALAETGLDPHYLELELTESSIMSNAEQSIKKLYELKEMGLQLSIDDFGTGYSSLNYLKRFPIDTLKIDQSFVRDISVSADDAAIVRAIITLAHSLKLNVIAEGVETAEQLMFLRQLKCDEMQGFWYSQALAAPQIETLLRERQKKVTGDK